MTKRRRKKINKNIHGAAFYNYVRKGKFDHLVKQGRLYNKHESYLCKMGRRSFDRLVKRLREKYKE